VLHSLREGVAYTLRTPLVFWSLTLLAGIAAFGFNFQILLPLFATQVLALDADGYGALYAALGIGSLSGSLTLAFMRQRRAIPLMLIGGSIFSGLLLGLGFARSVWMAVPLVVATGYFAMLMINTINATVQANVPDALRGRVMAFYVTVFAGSAPLGGLFAGAVAEAWGTPAAFLVGSAFSAITVGGVALGLRGARARGPLGVTIIDSSSRRPDAAAARSEASPVSATR
jgi:MFS family permease